MVRDESGAKTFQLFPRKNENRMKIWKRNFEERKQKRKLLGGNGTTFSGETGVEQRFPAKQARKRNFRFRLIQNFRFWQFCMANQLGPARYLIK